MKKIGIFLVVICIALGALLYQFRYNSDRKCPEIFVNSEVIYDETVTEAQLLEGVVAIDDKDEDVSDTLAVESVYRISDSEATVIYVAKDKSNNIAKLSYTLKANPPVETPAETPTPTATPEPTATPAPTETPVPTEAPAATETPTPVPTEVPAEPTPEPAAETVEEPAVVSEPETTAEENADVDAEQAKAEQEAIADAMAPGSPRIYLHTYVEHVRVGDKIELASYVKEIQDDVKDDIFDLWRVIQVAGEPDVNTPGVYDTEFYIFDKAGNISNRAVLKFIVE